MMMLIITREEAQEQGLTKYFTGKPCKHGHLAERYVNQNACIECKILQRKKFYSKNKDKIQDYNKKYKTENPEIIKQNSKKYLSKRNKLKHNAARRNYYHQKVKNSDQLLEKKRKRNREWRKKDHAKRYTTDPDYRCNKMVRNILDRTLKASMKNKEGRTHELLGYTAQEFRQHIERQFQKGMNWDNHGEWHIDHIHPISRFIEEGITDPKIINALSNLTPIWKTNNLSKGAKVTQLL